MLPFLGVDAITLLTTLFWVWMLIDCLFNKQVRGGSKVFWFLLIFFTQFVGALIYFFVACSQRNPVDAFTYYYRSIAGPAKQQPKHYQANTYRSLSRLPARVSSTPAGTSASRSGR